MRFKELIKKRAEIREKELLEYHNAELPNSIEKEKKIQKKLMDRIKKEKRENFNFQYMIKHIGKDKRGSLRRIQVKDSDGSII